LGWCAGRNPTFVLTAFSYTGYPRLPQNSQTPIRPFTLQDSRFTAANRILNVTHASSSSHGWTFRFCSGTKALAPHPYGCCSSAWWAEFPQAQDPKPSASSPTHKQQSKDNKIKILIFQGQTFHYLLL